MERTAETGDRRRRLGPDRRRFPRGGRRDTDQPGRHPKLAVIDHYDGVRRTCVRYLKHFNFDVAEAADAQAGLTVLESGQPALVLMEQSKSSAYDQLLRYARSRSVRCILLVIAGGDAEDGRCDGVLQKPFALGEMLDEIRRVLQLHDGH